MKNKYKFEPEPRCKVCNSEWVGLYHKLYSSGYSIRKIKEKSLQVGDSISKSSFYRHFQRHYTKVGKNTEIYDYSKDDSYILQGMDAGGILSKIIDTTSYEETLKLNETYEKNKSAILGNIDEQPIVTAKMFKEVIIRLLKYSGLDHLLEKLDDYDEIVEDVKKSEYYAHFRK